MSTYLKNFKQLSTVRTPNNERNWWFVEPILFMSRSIAIATLVLEINFMVMEKQEFDFRELPNLRALSNSPTMLVPIEKLNY